MSKKEEFLFSQLKLENTPYENLEIALDCTLAQLCTLADLKWYNSDKEKKLIDEFKDKSAREFIDHINKLKLPYFENYVSESPVSVEHILYIDKSHKRWLSENGFPMSYRKSKNPISIDKDMQEFLYSLRRALVVIIHAINDTIVEYTTMHMTNIEVFELILTLYDDSLSNVKYIKIVPEHSQQWWDIYLYAITKKNIYVSASAIHQLDEESHDEDLRRKNTNLLVESTYGSLPTQIKDRIWNKIFGIYSCLVVLPLNPKDNYVTYLKGYEE